MSGNRRYTSLPLYYATRQELKQAWGDWLGSLADWDWYATLTFRDPEATYRDYTEESGLLYQGRSYKVLDCPGYTKPGWGYAKGAWNKFVKAIGLPLGEVSYVRMFELQKARGVPHIHALIAGEGLPRRDEAWQWWFTRYGIARILPYESKLGATFYLCKYITKEIADIDFGGIGQQGIDKG